MAMTTTEPTPFGFMLRKPGDAHNVYLAPDYAEPHREITTDATNDPRWGENAAQDWCLSLPHRCDEWNIGDGSRDDVLTEAKRFRAELDAAIAVMETADE